VAFHPPAAEEVLELDEDLVGHGTACLRRWRRPFDRTACRSALASEPSSAPALEVVPEVIELLQMNRTVWVHTFRHALAAVFASIAETTSLANPDSCPRSLTHAQRSAIVRACG
jgi:hypothetical protein